MAVLGIGCWLLDAFLNKVWFLAWLQTAKLFCWARLYYAVRYGTLLSESPRVSFIEVMSVMERLGAKGCQGVRRAIGISGSDRARL